MHREILQKGVLFSSFSPYYHGLLPTSFLFFGFALTAMNDDEFRSVIMATLTCRFIDGRKCSEKMNEFLARCLYYKCNYSDQNTFEKLDRSIASGFEGDFENSDRLFYFAILPKLFGTIAAAINEGSRAPKGLSHVVVEKKFGQDLRSCHDLRLKVSVALTESDTFRIDQVLAIELVRNLMTHRFANSIFEFL